MRKIKSKEVEGLWKECKGKRVYKVYYKNKWLTRDEFFELQEKETAENIKQAIERGNNMMG